MPQTWGASLHIGHSSKREEYLKHLHAHGERCRPTDPGTLAFEILVSHDQTGTILLYELYANKEAFDLHWNGPSIQQARKDGEGLVVKA